MAERTFAEVFDFGALGRPEDLMRIVKETGCTGRAIRAWTDAGKETRALFNELIHPDRSPSLAETAAAMFVHYMLAAQNLAPQEKAFLAKVTSKVCRSNFNEISQAEALESLRYGEIIARGVLDYQRSRLPHGKQCVGKSS